MFSKFNGDGIEKFIKFIGGYTVGKDEVKTLCEETNNKYLIDCHIGYLKKQISMKLMMIKHNN